MSAGSIGPAARRPRWGDCVLRRWVVTAVTAAALLTASCAGEAPSVSALIALANNEAASGQCAEAIVTFTRVLSMSANNLTALRGRASCDAQLGQYAQAISDYSEVTRVTKSAGDFLTLAGWEWDAGYISQAGTDLGTASRLAADNADVTELLNIAAAQLSYSFYTGASLTLGRIPVKARFSEWYLLSGTLAAALFNVPAMRNDFTAAVRMSPKSQLAPALVTEANAFWNLGHYDRAIAVYQEALGSEGSIDRAQVYVQMGYAYDRIGDFQAAIREYRAALAEGLPLSAQQATEYAIAADFVTLRQVSQARTALAPLLRAHLTPALRAQVHSLEAALSEEG